MLSVPSSASENASFQGPAGARQQCNLNIAGPSCVLPASACRIQGIGGSTKCVAPNFRVRSSIRWSLHLQSHCVQLCGETAGRRLSASGRKCRIFSCSYHLLSRTYPHLSSITPAPSVSLSLSLSLSVGMMNKRLSLRCAAFAEALRRPSLPLVFPCRRVSLL